jgi:hypothetical protein
MGKESYIFYFLIKKSFIMREMLPNYKNSLHRKRKHFKKIVVAKINIKIEPFWL